MSRDTVVGVVTMAQAPLRYVIGGLFAYGLVTHSFFMPRSWPGISDDLAARIANGLVVAAAITAAIGAVVGAILVLTRYSWAKRIARPARAVAAVLHVWTVVTLMVGALIPLFPAEYREFLVIAWISLSQGPFAILSVWALVALWRDRPKWAVATG